ncbi:MAG: copper oxidase, partial [Thermoleophilia bacterium]|nr:copper oxidase [Thermoleophilia bacterium]
MGSTRHARARRATAWIGAISVVVGMVAVAGPALARPDGPPPPPPPRRPGAATATTQLAIPPVLELRRVGGVANVDLEARSGTVVRGGRRLRTAGYNGVYLAPTIRVARGERVQFHVKDSMAEPTTVHWHGLHVPAAGDGGPYQPIEPGATWNPAPFTIKQAATTLWYHPHLMGQTERQVSAGMAGFLLVDDPASAAQAALPHTYGVDDIPLLVQPLPSGGPGPASRDMAVNGSPNAELRTTKSRLRLRLVNASAGEMLRITVAGAKASWQVGSDGGLLEAPFATREVRLGPSERAELVVDVDAGRRMQLLAQSFAGPPGPGGRAGRPLLTIRNTAPT